MKLRSKLIIVFLLLAVVPLSTLTVYSYYASTRALRRAVEAESGRTTREMEHRMASVTDGLRNRIRNLEEIPFGESMTGGWAEDPGSNPQLIGRMLRALGDAAGFIDEFEVVHLRLPGVAPDPPPAPRPGGQVASVPGSGRVIIRLPGVVKEFATNPNLAGIIEGVTAMITPEDMARIETAIVSSLGGFDTHVSGIIEEEITAPAGEDPARPDGAPAHRMNRVAHLELSAVSKHRGLLLKQEFGCELRQDGKQIGHLTARIDSERLLHEVLSRTPLEEGEIPFARDAEGNLYTPDPADLPALRNLQRVASWEEGAVMAGESPDGKWVVVTREDPISGLAFGIAHPLGESLEEIRRTSTRNFAAGMGLVAIALLGVLPLSRRMTQNLTDLTRGAHELAAGNLAVQVPVRSKDEMGQLAIAFNQMARDLKKNQERLVQQERLRRELELCRRIQNDLLPKAPYRDQLAEMQGVSIPARELGGDFFNYFNLGDGQVAILMGDVSGKGVPAALLMANLQATLRARLPLEPDLARFAGALDREIEASTPDAVYLTLFLGIFDSVRHELRYVNAGHESPFLLHGSGDLERLQPSGRPIGLLSGGGYEERRVTLRSGDRLFLYTDGLTDAEDARGVAFGEKRIATLLAGAAEQDPATLLARIERAFKEHRGGIDAADDATLLVIRIGDPGPAAS